MANLGLLGALQGLGQGLVSVGKDIAARRQAALEDAKQLAKEQRSRSYAVEDREDNQANRADISAATQAAQTSRTEAVIAGRATENEANREFKTEQGVVTRAHAEDMVRLREDLQRDTSEAGIRLRESLKSDTKGVTYGAPKTAGQYKGYSEVIRIDRNGGHHSTGQFIMKPQASKAKPLGDDDDEEL